MNNKEKLKKQIENTIRVLYERTRKSEPICLECFIKKINLFIDRYSE